MRIISGKSRGTKLYTLEGEQTRPTLDRVREALFNIIQNEIVGSVFLDLFAGSGAVGLEAASRGAKEAILCEKNNGAIEIINKNIEKTHLENQVKLYKMSYEKLLESLNTKVDLVYLDPPYKTDYICEALKIMTKRKVLNKDATIILETDDEQRILKRIANLELEIVDQRKYGRVHLIFLKEKQDDEKGA